MQAEQWGHIGGRKSSISAKRNESFSMFLGHNQRTALVEWVNGGSLKGIGAAEIKQNINYHGDENLKLDES